MTFIICEVDVGVAFDAFRVRGFTKEIELPLKGMTDKKGGRIVMGNLALEKKGFDGLVRVEGRRESGMVEIDATSYRDLCLAFNVLDISVDGLGKFIAESSLKF